MVSWIKAKIALIAIGIVWGSLIILFLPLILVTWLLEKESTVDIKDRWLYSIAIAQDIAVNTVFGGYFRTTISSECGNLKLQGSSTGTNIADFIDKGFELAIGQKNHCLISIEPEDKHYVTANRAILGFVCYILGLALCWLLLTGILGLL